MTTKTCEACGATCSDPHYEAGGVFVSGHSENICLTRQLTTAKAEIVKLTERDSALKYSKRIVEERCSNAEASLTLAKAEITRLEENLKAAAVNQQKIVDDVQAFLQHEIVKRGELEADIARGEEAETKRAAMQDRLLAKLAAATEENAKLAGALKNVSAAYHYGDDADLIIELRAVRALLGKASLPLPKFVAERIDPKAKLTAATASEQATAGRLADYTPLVSAAYHWERTLRSFGMGSPEHAGACAALERTVEDMSDGTFQCPICGFDKPHKHDHRTVEWHRTGNTPDNTGPLNDNQRESIRSFAESEWRESELRREFENNPRVYIENHGTINSLAGSLVVPWLLARLEDREAKLSQMAVESISTSAMGRLRKAAEAEGRRLERELEGAAFFAVKHRGESVAYDQLRDACSALAKFRAGAKT